VPTSESVFDLFDPIELPSSNIHEFDKIQQAPTPDTAQNQLFGSQISPFRGLLSPHRPKTEKNPFSEQLLLNFSFGDSGNGDSGAKQSEAMNSVLAGLISESAEPPSGRSGPKKALP